MPYQAFSHISGKIGLQHGALSQQNFYVNNSISHKQQILLNLEYLGCPSHALHQSLID